jgi:Integrase core domain
MGAGQGGHQRRRLVVRTRIAPSSGRLRDECLNEHLFNSLPEARRLIEDWMIDYNTD